jgi:TPR repeat protein
MRPSGGTVWLRNKETQVRGRTLASCITMAKECRRTTKEAVRWFRLAAEQGSDAAQSNLALAYYEGRGVPQDYKEAVRWYGLAAEQGNASSQNDLGTMYYQGKGVPQDYVQAHMWFNLAGANGNANGVKNRDIVASKMAPGQIAEAQRLAREWMPKSSKRRPPVI